MIRQSPPAPMVRPSQSANGGEIMGDGAREASCGTFAETAAADLK